MQADQLFERDGCAVCLWPNTKPPTQDGMSTRTTNRINDNRDRSLTNNATYICVACTFKENASNSSCTMCGTSKQQQVRICCMRMGPAQASQPRSTATAPGTLSQECSACMFDQACVPDGAATCSTCRAYGSSGIVDIRKCYARRSHAQERQLCPWGQARTRKSKL